MAGVNETPSANRTHIAFFGLRNAGKSTLVNAFTGQDIAIVSDIPGTTTDPVSKAMEILPLGPCLITDTAGLDDEGALGELRVKKTLAVLSSTDIAVWVGGGFEEWRKRFAGIPVVVTDRGADAGELRRKVASVRLEESVPGLLDGLAKRGDRVLCVCPIDESAPKGRLILPQQQVIRECLEKGIVATVCQPDNLPDGDFDLVVTDSQAFAKVAGKYPRITSFSILFARQKGDLAEFRRGLEAAGNLKDGDLVLVAEACTHHRQCNDIGTVKIPAAVRTLCGAKPRFAFASGKDFAGKLDGAKLAVHCGGCMLTRREMLARIAAARERGVPVVNYGLLLQKALCGVADAIPAHGSGED